MSQAFDPAHRSIETRDPEIFRKYGTGRHRWLAVSLWLTFLLVFGRNPGAAAVLDLGSSGSSEILPLEVGDDLWIEASKLPAGTALDLILSDDQGVELRRLEVRPGQDGRLLPRLLWFRTGVVGCDLFRCQDEIQPLEFSSFQQAETALLGRTFSVFLELSNDHQLIAEASVLLVPRRGPRAFFADRNGCPRYRFEDQEDIFLAAFGGPAEPLRVFLTAARSQWRRSGNRFHEIRGYGQGVLLRPGVSGELLSKAGALPVGAYSAVLRSDLGNMRQVLSGDDTLLIRYDIDKGSGPTHDDGLIINDWGDDGDFCLP